MTEITQRLNELEAAAEELALVEPYADEYPEYYQTAYDEWLRAQERYQEAISRQSEVDPGPLWCEDDAIDDDEDYDDTQCVDPSAPPPAPAAPTTNEVSGEGGVLDLGADQGAEQDEDEVYGPDNPYRLEDLTQDPVPVWLDVTIEDYHEFKREVYRECVRRAARTRGFVRGIAAESLGSIGVLEFRLELVGDGERLLAAADADLAIAQAAGDERAALARAPIGLASAYRHADTQFGLWNNRFTGTYMTRHRGELEALAGEALSEAWVSLLARKIGAATGAPGYSLHQRGISLDFRSPQPGVPNEKTNTAMARWRDTWFYDWLVAHAAEYGFEPYDGEAWHWNYTALMNE